MTLFLSLTISGLATAAIYAIAASGLVLTYTTTGTFNFAHGAIGMMAAFVYWQVRYDWSWPAPLALAVVLLGFGPLFGVVLDRLIMRRLEGSSETTRLVVTVALLLGLIAAAIYIWDPQEARPLRQFFQGNVVEIGGVRIPWFQFIFLAVAAIVAAGLRLLLYRTRSGVAMRAAVDNRALATLNGARPDRSSMLAWAIGCSLASLSGILVAPTLTMSAVPLTLLIVNAYAAAVFGRLRSIPLTFVGAVVLGLSRDYGIGYLSKLPTDLQPYFRGFVDAIPAILLFVVVLLLPAGRLGGVARSREIAHRPAWGGSIAFAIVVVAGTAMVAPLLTDSDLVSIGKLWAIAIIGLSMVPVIGLAGKLSLAQLTFAGVGAIAYAHLGWENPLGLLWASIIAGAVGALVALPVIRLQGIYVALATAAFAVVCDRWLFTFPEFGIFGHDFEPFPQGLLPVIRPDFLGLDLTGSTAYFIFGSVVFAVLMLAVVALRRSRFGKRLIAVKEGPAAVATCGINVRATTLVVFALSAAIAGVGGAMLSASEPASIATFDFVASLPILVTMVIAGISSVGAPLNGGILLGTPLPTRLIPGFDRWQGILIGFAGVGLANNPNGFTADLRPASERVKRDPVVWVGLILVVVAIWALRMADVYGNGPWFVLTMLALIASPVAAQLRARRRASTTISEDELESGTVHALVASAEQEGEHLRGLHAPPELLGLTEPCTAEDVAALDEAIGLAQAEARMKGQLVARR